MSNRKKPVPFFDMALHRWFKVPYLLNIRCFHSPEHPREIVVLIHGLGNSLKSWEKIAKELPDDVQVIGIDMLGFGDSPRPEWARYDVKTQARSVGRTLVRMGLKRRPIIVGHSMGSLVAIEMAKRYPILIKRLILCSPPIYKKAEKEAIRNRDSILMEIYRVMIKHPDDLQRAAPLAIKLGIASKAFDVKGDLSQAYIAALEAAIINQTSLADIKRLRLPIKIIYGTLDPVVIGSHLKGLAKIMPNVSVKSFIVSHDMIGRYQKLLGRELHGLLSSAKIEP